ncbi:MAG: CapA family protein [Syntrophaceae bacterium]|nr:CapA family protein [Syntrophaceae bacterium]
MTSRTGTVFRMDPRLRETLAGADLFIANCEGPVMGGKKTERGFPWISFAMEEDFLRGCLKELGVLPSRCVLSVANNHIGDRGLEGLRSTLDCLGRMGVATVGQRGGAPPFFLSLERNGLRMGIAAWTHWQNRRTFDDFPAVLRGRDIIDSDWREIKMNGRLDLLVGIPHWGVEFHHFPRPEEKGLARLLAQRGFDILAGHHPHVLQPLEWLGKTPCFYSLGNVNGPPLPLLPWPIRLGAFLEIALGVHGEQRGRVAGFAVHSFFRLLSGGQERLLPMERTRIPLRRKLMERWNLLFPFPQGGTFLSTSSR